MALTWGTLLVGFVGLFGLPLAVVWLNGWKRHAGWWVLVALIAFIIVGDIIEQMKTGS